MNAYAWPNSSPARQNDRDVHETTLRSEVVWIRLGALQELPLKVAPARYTELSGSVKLPTAAQNEEDEQDTAWSSVPNGNACLDQLLAACAADGAASEPTIKPVRSATSSLRTSETIAAGAYRCPGPRNRSLSSLTATQVDEI